MGYEEGAKAYRLWNDQTNKIIVCRNVIFNEDVFPFNSSTSNEHVDYSFLEDFSPSSTENQIVELPSSVIPENNPETSNIPPPAPANSATRPKRIIQQPSRLGHFIAHHTTSLCSDKPTYKQAMMSSDSDKWREAMAAEFTSLKEPDVGRLVPLPSNARSIGGMWVLFRKRELGVITKYKARWVALGNHQIEGIDYNATYAAVGKADTLRLLIAIAVYLKCRVYSFDITTAFLHGLMKEKVYVRQVRGFEERGKEDQVWELVKSLYGTKQGAQDFSDHLEEKMVKMGFKKSTADSSLFILRKAESFVYVHMHVDDGFVISNSTDLIEEFTSGLLQSYNYRWRENPSSHLGIHLSYNDDGSIFIDQAHYLEEVSERFEMEDCNSVKNPFATGTSLVNGTEDEVKQAQHYPYMSLVGSLMYAAVCTRPDITYAVNRLAQFNSCYTEHHWLAAKHVLRYVKGSLNRGIHYRPTDGLLRGYADADYANDEDSRRSVTGFLFTFGSSIFSWKSKRQRTVALSTTEAEYMSLSDCSRHALWLKNLFCDLQLSYSSMSTSEDSLSAVPIFSAGDAISLFNDNNGTVLLTQEPIINDKSKHIDIRYHFIRENVKCHNITTHHLATSSMPEDYLTKPLALESHLHCASLISNVENLC